MPSFETKNFLDRNGLKTFWALIKEYIKSVSDDINNYTNELIGTLPEDSTTVVEAINNGVSNAKSYADGLKTSIDTVIEENEIITAAALNDLNSRVEVLETGEENYVPWENVVNKPVISGITNSTGHKHQAVFNDNSGHEHRFSGSEGTTDTIGSHNHNINLTTSSDGDHTHAFTPSGTVILIGNLDGDVLTITAEFSSSDPLETSTAGAHTHSIDSQTDFAGDHTHAFTPSGTVENAHVTGEVEVYTEKDHVHVVEIDLNKNFSSESIIIQVSGSEFEEIINSQDNERYIQFMAKNTYLANNLTSLAVSPKDLEKLNDPNLAFILLLYHDNINDDEDIFNVMPIGLVSQGVAAGALELNENKVYINSNYLNGIISEANNHGENSKIGAALGYLREDSSFPQIIDSTQHIN